eukprot:s603_g4.t3
MSHEMTGKPSGSDDWEVQIHKQPWNCDESEESAEDTVDRRETDWQIHQLMPKIAKSIAQMDVTHPEISTFWSHSWHGGHWKKILTLIPFYNGTAAVSLGLLTGLLMMLLFCFGQLPGFSRGWENIRWSTWSLCSGVLVTCLVAIFWRPQTQVFFDRICISQANSELKTQAIFSLAGLLKSSDQMLILWDPTWTQRLWCLFELAAFLQSRKTRKQALIVRPVFLGPISIGLFLTMSILAMPATTVPIRNRTLVFIPMSAVLLLGMMAAYPAVSTLRNYFRDLDVMKQQLLSISFDTTRSACCDQDHVDPMGQTLLCDRRIVKECVDIWFGSQQAFEDTVRSEVLSILDHELSEKVFSTAWTLGVTSPIMLIFMDLCASFTSRAVKEDSIVWRSVLQTNGPPLFIDGLVIWLLAIPAAKDLLICFCRLLRKKPENCCLEALKNALTLLLILCPLVMLLALYGFAISTNVGGNRFLGNAILAGCVLILSVCNWLLAATLKALLKRLIFMDLCASYYASWPLKEDPMAWWSVLLHPAPPLFIDGLVIWLLAFPAAKDLLICFCRLLRKRPENCCLEALKNALTLLLILCPLVMLLASYALSICADKVFDVGDQRIIGTAILAGSVLILSVCNRLLAATLKALLKRPGW